MASNGATLPITQSCMMEVCPRLRKLDRITVSAIEATDRKNLRSLHPTMRSLHLVGIGMSMTSLMILDLPSQNILEVRTSRH